MDTVTNLAAQAWWALGDLPWNAILLSLGGSTVVATVTQFLKKRLNNKTKTKVLSIVGALALFPDILGNFVNNPVVLQYLPNQWASVFTGAVALHALLTTPPFRKLQQTLRQYRQALETVRESGNAPVQAIDNPNFTLNNPSQPSNITPPTSQPQVPEQKPLDIR